MLGEAKIFWWPNMSKEVEDKTKVCVAFMASVMNLSYQIPKKTSKTKTLTGPGLKLQISFSGNMNNKKLNEEHQILIAIDRFNTRLTVKICKSSETIEVLNF